MDKEFNGQETTMFKSLKPIGEKKKKAETCQVAWSLELTSHPSQSTVQIREADEQPKGQGENQ